MVVLTYPSQWYHMHRIATETDVLSRRTLLDTGGTVRVSRGSAPYEPAFTIKYTNSQPSKAPPMPHINLCH